MRDAIRIWKAHCVLVVMAQQVAFMCNGKISAHTFQEMGPRETEKENAKM